MLPIHLCEIASHNQSSFQLVPGTPRELCDGVYKTPHRSTTTHRAADVRRTTSHNFAQLEGSIGRLEAQMTTRRARPKGPFVLQPTSWRPDLWVANPKPGQKAFIFKTCSNGF